MKDKREQDITNVRFQVLKAASMKLRIFWDVGYCFHHQPDDGGSTHL
jgi:hypothetical protein